MNARDLDQMMLAAQGEVVKLMTEFFQMWESRGGYGGEVGEPELPPEVIAQIEQGLAQQEG